MRSPSRRTVVAQAQTGASSSARTSHIAWKRRRRISSVSAQSWPSTPWVQPSAFIFRNHTTRAANRNSSPAEAANEYKTKNPGCQPQRTKTKQSTP